MLITKKCMLTFKENSLDIESHSPLKTTKGPDDQNDTPIPPPPPPEIPPAV